MQTPAEKRAQVRYRERHPEKVRAASAAWALRNRQQVRDTRCAYYRKKKAFLHRYKTERRCRDCGEQDPIVLEFHHRDRALKAFHIGQQNSVAWDRMIAEIAKCDVLCANCHRRATYKEYNP